MTQSQSQQFPPSQPVLQTSRLLLRPFSIDDVDDVCAIVDSPSVASTTRSISLPFTQAMAQEWIAPQAENWKSQSAAVFAICWGGDGLHPQSECAGNGRAEISEAVAAYRFSSLSTESGRSGRAGACDGLRLIGAVGLEIYEEDEKGELGYWVSEDFWGRGVATEAARALVGFGFDVLCLHKVVAYHMVRNPASGRVLEKIGMQQEGIFRDHVKKWDQFEDVAAYGILASDLDLGDSQR
jgi:RimJ/RimL family protein N-acetyltransferase